MKEGATLGRHMRKDITIKSATLSGTTDLTVLATIKSGFVPSLDAVTYKTRVKRVLKALHLGRTTAHEYDLFRAMSDAVERVGRIHSIRIALLEPHDQVLLAVTFDGSWESYIRVIWQKVSCSLDLIFCNTEGYVPGGTSSFEDWSNWLRNHQPESPFFYAPPGLSYLDTQYLAAHERLSRRTVDGARRDLNTTRLHLSSAEAIADNIIDVGVNPMYDGTEARDDDALALFRESFRQGLRSLVGLHRLGDWYLLDTADGHLLHRAAVELLREFYPVVMEAHKTPDSNYATAIARAERRFMDALDWLRTTDYKPREVPEPPSKLALSDADLADVQAGILFGVPNVSEGCLVFLACDTADALSALLASIHPTSAGLDLRGTSGICINLTLTPEAFYLAGYTDTEIASLPEEFVQGMERRAGILGDLRHNHPRRWRRPALNWSRPLDEQLQDESAMQARLEFSEVHAVLQLRSYGDKNSAPAPDRQALWDHANKQLGGIAGVRPLAIQWMQVLQNAAGQQVEHFGYLDGGGTSSQPEYDKSKAGRLYSNTVHAGEVLRGYANASDMAPDRAKQGALQALLHNGSFLVVRKLQQNVAALEQALAAAMTANGVAEGDKQATRQLYLAKMMGRWHGDAGNDAGQPLLPIPPASPTNDFTYGGDSQGAVCPFHAHIRRANPRELPDTAHPLPPNGERPARIVRRSMPYGAPALLQGEGKEASLAQERGMVFMAYNAHIGEQFEVIQRWLTGGNSSGSYSGESDPFLGVAESGQPRCFKFEHQGHIVRIPLDQSANVTEEPVPLVQLAWGVYLFTPGLQALKRIAERASQVPKGVFVRQCWSVEQGRKAIADLRLIESTQPYDVAMDAWKQALEDPNSVSDFSAASIWAAIRADHGGVLKTPFGVLAASRALVDTIVKDERNLTATGFLPRMQRSFGELYLGLDGGQVDQRYEREAAEANAAVMALADTIASYQATREQAKTKLLRAIDNLVAQARDDAVEDEEPAWSLTFDAREIIDTVLADLCETLFGLSEMGGHLQRGGARADDGGKGTARYPGHFMAPSRYVFQPHPGPDVERIASAQGQALSRAMTDYLVDHGSGITAPLTRRILDSTAAKADASYAARTLSGILMGFVPTLDGNLRRILNDWLSDGCLWRLRSQRNSAGAEGYLGDLRALMLKTMQLRAAPELLWRTAVTAHTLGDGPHAVAVRPGHMVVAALISASHQCVEEGDDNLHYAFGGERGQAVQVPPGQARHACPGYGPALAVIEGFFTGLVECPHPLRPGPAPLSFQVEGRVQLPPSAPSSTLWLSDHVSLFAPIAPAPTAALIPLTIMGDSWMTHVPPSMATMLIMAIDDLGFKTPKSLFYPYTGLGKTLAQMAEDNNLDMFESYLKQQLADPEQWPRAVLLDGGGNDLVQDWRYPKETALFKLLVKSAQTAETALDTDATNDFINNVICKLHRKVCAKIIGIIDASPHKTVPVLIHGYAYPCVTGKPSDAGNKPGPWLKSVFDKALIKDDLSIRNAVMRTLIDRLNDAIAQVASEPAFGGKVHHIRLAGVFEKQPDYDSNDPAKRDLYWANELHPTPKGCELLARVYREKFIALQILS